MLPIPFYGVKKWAPQLMVDGIFSAILVFSYNILRWIIDYMGGVLGVDWDEYYTWFTSEVNIVITTIIMLKMLGIGLSSIGLGFFANSLLSPLISSLTYLLIFLITVTTLVSAITMLSNHLLALGILLHALPFRLTRSSGATLLALVIVFSIGTPLMPQFINTITPSTGMTEKIGYGYLLSNIIVYDAIGQAVPYYLYEIYSLNNTLLARYLADENGVVNASSILKGIPSSKHYAHISLAGYEYWKIIDPSNYVNITASFHTNITINLNELYVLRPLRLVIVFNASLIVMHHSNTELHGVLNVEDMARIIVVGLDSDNIWVYINGSYWEPINTYYYGWGGVDFKAHEYMLSANKYIMHVFVFGDSVKKPYFEEKYYARDTLNLSVEEPVSIVYPISILIYRLFIAPIIYLSILFSTTLALARLLGGSSSKIMRVMVSGI